MLPLLLHILYLGKRDKLAEMRKITPLFFLVIERTVLMCVKLGSRREFIENPQEIHREFIHKEEGKMEKGVLPKSGDIILIGGFYGLWVFRA